MGANSSECVNEVPAEVVQSVAPKINDQNLYKLVERPAYLNTFQWDGTGARYSKFPISISTYVQNDYIGATTDSIRKMMYSHLMFSGKVNYNISWQGNPYLFGKMLVYAQPYTFNGLYPVNATRVHMFPHVVIDPSINGSAVLSLPPIDESGMFSISSDPTFSNTAGWKVFCMIINPLQSGNDATDTYITITFTVFLTEMSLTTPVITLSSVRSFDMKASGIINTLSDVGKKTASFLHSIGFSKPMVEPTNILATYDFNPKQKVAGGSTALTTSVEKHDVPINVSLPLHSVDDMSFRKLCAIPNYIDTISFSSDLPPATLLSTYYASPTINPTTSRVGEIHTTTMGMVAFNFNLWRGTIIFDFEVIASITSRATLAVVYGRSHYGRTDMLASMATYPTTYVDISGNCNFSIEIPYQDPAPFLQVHGSNTNALGPLTLDFENTPEESGFVRLYILNSLRSQNSSTVDINVFYRSPDVIFAEPIAGFGHSQPIVYLGLTNEVNGTEELNSVKQLAMLDSQFGVLAFPALSSGHFTTINIPRMITEYHDFSAGGITLTEQLSNLYFFSSMYLGYKGSINFYAPPDQQTNTVGCGSIMNTPSTLCNLLSTFVPVSQYSVVYSHTANGSFEFELSHRSNRRIVYPPLGLTPVTFVNTLVSEPLLTFRPGAVAGKYFLFSSAGDDFQYIGFKGPPIYFPPGPG